MINFQTDKEEVLETSEDDEDASLDDTVLDEVSSDTDDTDEEVEGFGHITEGDEDEDEDEAKESSDDDDGEEVLEEDAEDVDYDTFDDIDEM